jgi:AcrR family transcriptional regulator
MHNETKHILLKVARNLIDEEGISAISMRTVGKLAGLSRTALYRHFKNKESLLASIAVENFTKLGEVINKLERDTVNPRQRIFEFLNIYFHYGVNNSAHYQLMFNTKWDDTKYPDIRQAANGLFIKGAFFVSEAMPFKSSNPKILIEKTALLYAFIHGLVELHLSGHNEASKGLDDIASLINHALEAILHK